MIVYGDIMRVKLKNVSKKYLGTIIKVKTPSGSYINKSTNAYDFMIYVGLLNDDSNAIQRFIDDVRYVVLWDGLNTRFEYPKSALEIISGHMVGCNSIW